MHPGGQKQRLVSYSVPVKKNALGPSEAACIEQYTVTSKQGGGWLVTLLVYTPKVSLPSCLKCACVALCQHLLDYHVLSYAEKKRKGKKRKEKKRKEKKRKEKKRKEKKRQEKTRKEKPLGVQYREV